MSEFKREFEEAFENEKDLEITLSKAMTYILYLERETQSLEEQNKELIRFLNDHAIQFECCDVCKFLSEHKHYQIQDLP